MKVYKGSCASPGLVLGQVSRLEHHVETTTSMVMPLVMNKKPASMV